MSKTVSFENISVVDAVNEVAVLKTAIEPGSSVALSLDDNSDLAQNDYVLIGEIGSPKSEIAQINAIVTEGTAIQVDTITYAHGVHTAVRKLPYNQVKLYHAATVDGAKTLEETLDIDADNQHTHFETTETSGYFFFTLYNEQTTTETGYSAEISASGYAENSVGAVIEAVFSDMNESFDSMLTPEMVFRALTRMMQDVRGQIKTWSHYRKYDFSIGPIVEGTAAYPLPEDIYDDSSVKSIQALKIDGEEITYVSKQRYDILKESYGTHETSSSYYSVFDGNVNLLPIPGTIIDDKALTIDYATDIEVIRDYNDIIKGERYDMAYYYLKAFVRSIREGNSKIDFKDTDYILYANSVEYAKRHNETGKRKGRAPNVRGIVYRRTRG